jgi:nucleotide-binding universal stress UspA family protein
MFSHILIAADATEVSEKAIQQGIALAKILDSKVTIVHVSEPWNAAVSGEWVLAFPREEYEKIAAANAQTILEKAAQQASAAGLLCHTVHVSDQYAAEGIVEEAEKCGCDLIVMGSHGRRGFARFLLGSQATRVLTQSPVPVLICK